MSGACVPLAVAPLRLTLWVLAVTTAVIVVLIAILIARHVQWVRADRRRERVRHELGPMFSRFLATEDQARLAEELHPAIRRLDAAHRPVAAVLVIDLMDQATSPSQTGHLRHTLEESGIVELTEKGTRRLSPWRRALACEVLGKIGARRSVPALLARLGDRRPEVRMAAVRALGDIGSAEAVPALAEAFLQRRCAPTNMVNDALRRIGGQAAAVFEQGVCSHDPLVRVSSCFGLAAIADGVSDRVRRLTEVLASDSDAHVRMAAAAALGIVGGDHASAVLLNATCDEDVHVRRSALKALGSFDDPRSGATLSEHAKDEEDRESALRAAEALLALTRRPLAASEARAQLESSSAWAVEYARKVAELSA